MLLGANGIIIMAITYMQQKIGMHIIRRSTGINHGHTHHNEPCKKILKQKPKRRVVPSAVLAQRRCQSRDSSTGLQSLWNEPCRWSRWVTIRLCTCIHSPRIH